ncbi:DNA N-glycosylase and apurinic/apyrimidinic (AP) lyase [Mortierella polycephala]|uniref:Endonuclease III homolog n=1 Tax=Mortierella polycephala TaxID=41804 RepID=A0A9P6QBY8_9FUNG|nr:DNA N-glycosylase and apurinic/apyrimidinic (AP) lyase [Mortierella polycephala]
MATRSSTRLRNARAKEEQGDTSTPATSSTSLTTSTGLSKRSGASTRTTRPIVKNEDGEPDEQTLKKLKLEADDHRRALAAEKRSKRSSAAVSEIKQESESKGGAGLKKSKYATKEPPGWEVTLDRLREFRLHNPAPVDTMGCERLAQVGDHIPPEVSRFQTLMALVLSSQTKDTVTSVAIWKLQAQLKGGLTIEGVLNVPSEELNSMIGAVGFHNKKTIFMKQIAEICRTQYKGDIPDNAKDLIALPGVGPKMAYLTLQCAWNKNLGIGVDTHVHRISNRLGWVKTEKDGPEGTREALQSWLPKEHWREINHIMVGFGQVLCLPRGPLCPTCPVQERCPSATGISKPRKKLIAELKKEKEEPFGEVDIHLVHMHAPKKKRQSADKIAAVHVKKEEDKEESPYFASGSGPVQIKQEAAEDEAMHHTTLLNGDLHVDASNMDKEEADIEDLIS